MSDPAAEELWRKIVVIHNYTKAHLIYCEEANIEHKTFIQPRNELCNALEHVVRSKARELGVTSGLEETSTYCQANLDKVIGHEFRAFFDVCDWLGMILRERTLAELEGYSVDAIHKAIPNYFSEIRPRLEKIPEKIAEVRSRKDIGGDILQEVEEYNRILGELKTFCRELYACKPSLNAFRKSERIRVFWRVAAIVFSVALGWFLKEYVSRQSSPSPPAEAEHSAP